ncbi:hypothetical protein I6N95_03620 [Vagococcus sp. BWB3-3]|uniref:Uncharacterized protein n=1 Tax=Vagococcus allomyrinae TaxID=2794353 RepID=A0A940P5F2_9ENTE|nr:hypothetical protein [Vagococcus allomyrinae]MBP1040096.1 hypothetical protein [Vagococcus allomyrinae]
MAQTAFLSHAAEIGYTSIGKKSKQQLPNLKETVESDTMVALGNLFVKLIPKDDVKLEEVVTVKRTRHQMA